MQGRRLTENVETWPKVNNTRGWDHDGWRLIWDVCKHRIRQKDILEEADARSFHWLKFALRQFFFPKVNLWKNLTLQLLCALLPSKWLSQCQLRKKRNPLPQWDPIISVPKESFGWFSGINQLKQSLYPYTTLFHIIFYVASNIFPFLLLRKPSTIENPN